MDQNTANVVIAFIALLNTAILTYQAIRIQSVHSIVNGQKTADVQAAHSAGVMEGLQSSSVGKLPTRGGEISPHD